MCNLFNTFFGGCANQSTGYNYTNQSTGCGYVNNCNQCNCLRRWNCCLQRVCRDCNGNIVVIGNQSCSNVTENNNSACSYSCENASTQSSTSATNNYGYARCRSWRNTGCGCNQ